MHVAEADVQDGIFFLARLPSSTLYTPMQCCEAPVWSLLGRFCCSSASALPLEHFVCCLCGGPANVTGLSVAYEA